MSMSASMRVRMGGLDAEIGRLVDDVAALVSDP
jgi:hypothetical protein